MGAKVKQNVMEEAKKKTRPEQKRVNPQLLSTLWCKDFISEKLTIEKMG